MAAPVKGSLFLPGRFFGGIYFVMAYVGCPPGIRTPIDRFRADCPTIERVGNRLKEPQMVSAGGLLKCTRCGNYGIRAVCVLHVGVWELECARDHLENTHV